MLVEYRVGDIPLMTSIISKLPNIGDEYVNEELTLHVARINKVDDYKYIVFLE